jgi:hypothetical protein
VRLAALLETVSTRSVTLPELWTLWAAADPGLAGHHDQRLLLAQTLEQLAEAGLARPSKKQDISARPHLPARVTLPPPTPSESAAALARTVAWRPELSWVLSARLTLGQVEQLRVINTWLRDRNRDDDVIPLRERSLEILGHEKALDALIGTTVFGSTRLTLDHLRTFRTHPPLPVTRVGRGPVLLVVENDNTFHSVSTVLRDEPGAVGYVAWGAGGAFEASVRSAADLPGIELVRYFGDIDAAGLRIPRNAADTAIRESLPPVTPAVELYRALLATTVRQHGQSLVPADSAGTLSSWLGEPDLVSMVCGLLIAGVRVPQEALSLTALAANRNLIIGR